MGLISVDEYKDYAGLSQDDPIHDVLLGTLIDASSDIIERWCHREFKKVPVTEWIDGTGTAIISVSRPPIASVTSVSLYDNGGTGAEEVLEPGSYTVHTSAGMIEFVASTSFTRWGYTKFPFGAKNIKVVYDGGFTVVPTPITLACKLLTSQYYQRRGGDPSLSGESGAGWAMSVGPDGLPAMVTALMAPYKVLLMKSIVGNPTSDWRCV